MNSRGLSDTAFLEDVGETLADVLSPDERERLWQLTLAKLATTATFINVGLDNARQLPPRLLVEKEWHRRMCASGPPPPGWEQSYCEMLATPPEEPCGRLSQTLAASEVSLFV